MTSILRGASNNYAYLNGTSMAAPHVTGLVALLAAKDPGLNATQLKALVLDNGDPVTALLGYTVTGKRINAFNSMQQAGGAVVANQPPTANAGPDQAIRQRTFVRLDGTGSSDADGAIASYAWTQLSGTSVILSGASTAKPTFFAPVLFFSPSAKLTFRLTVTDDDGAKASDDVVVTVTR